MKKMYVALVASLVVICLGVFGVNPLSWVQAAQQAPTDQIGPVTTVPGVAVPIQVKTDLFVDQIYANQCPCPQDHDAVDAILMKGVNVVVKNKGCPDGKSATASGKVKLTAFDFGTNSFKTVTKPFPAIAPGGSHTVTITAQSYLVKKSTGIKAEVIADLPAVDCNPGNNVKTVNTCNLWQPPPIY